MSNWHLGPLLCFDTETSGVDVFNDRIVTACAALVDGSGQQPPQIQQWLINPGVEIPQAAIDVHGITNERAREDGADPKNTLAEIASVLADALEQGTPVVGFNVAFDLTLLEAECARHGVIGVAGSLGRPIAPVVDATVLDKRVDKYRKGSRKLIATCEVYEVRLDGAHDATADALASARIAWRICQRYPEIAGMSLEQLHAAQVGWAAEQAAGLQRYFRKTKPDAVVDGSWPVRGLAQDVAA